MPRLALLVVLAFAALVPSAVSAQVEAQEILWNCVEPPDETDYERVMLYFKCLGYIQGAHDMMAYLLTFGDGKTNLYCIPKKGISVDQLRRVVIKWIKTNPETMHWTARQVIQQALFQTFPCLPPRQGSNQPPPPRN